MCVVLATLAGVFTIQRRDLHDNETPQQHQRACLLAYGTAWQIRGWCISMCAFCADRSTSCAPRTSFVPRRVCLRAPTTLLLSVSERLASLGTKRCLYLGTEGSVLVWLHGAVLRLLRVCCVLRHTVLCLLLMWCVLRSLLGRPIRIWLVRRMLRQRMLWGVGML